MRKEWKIMQIYTGNWVAKARIVNHLGRATNVKLFLRVYNTENEAKEAINNFFNRLSSW